MTGKRKHKRRKKHLQTPEPGSRLFFFFFGWILLLLPVFYAPGAIDKSQMPRIILLGLLFLITTLTVFGNKNLRGIDFSVGRQKIFLFLGGYLLVVMFASFFAGNKQEVYFDLVRTLLFGSGVFFAAVILLRTPGWKEKLSKTVIIGAIPVLIIGMVQYLQRVVLTDDIRTADGRAIEYAVAGLMGHKNMYSSFLMLLLPFTVFGITSLKKRWRVGAVLVTCAVLIMIVLLKTRSVWVGTTLGSFFVLVLLIAFAKNFRLSNRLRTAVVLVLTAGIIGFVALWWTGRTAAPFSIPGRVYSIFDTQSHHNIHRINVWKGSIEMIRDHPVTGVGPGNWTVKAPYYFNHQFTEVSALRWARPHNDFIWVFSEKGMFGILFFLGIFATGFIYLVRIIKQKSLPANGNSRVLALCLFAALTAYLADAAFSFTYERIDIQALLFIVLAATVTLYHQHKPKNPLKPAPKLMILAGVVLFGFGSVYGYHGLRMETNIRKTRDAMRANDWDTMIHYARQAQTPFRSIDPSLYPVVFYEGVALFGMENYEEARRAFLKAKQYSPRNVNVLDQLGITYHRLGRPHEAIECAETILEVIPGLSNTLNNLAVYYYELGEYEEAYETLTRIDNWEDDPNIVHNVELMRSLIDE